MAWLFNPLTCIYQVTRDVDQGVVLHRTRYAVHEDDCGIHATGWWRDCRDTWRQVEEVVEVVSRWIEGVRYKLGEDN